MVLMDMSFVAGVIIRQRVFFSLVPAMATVLRSDIPVRAASFGRLFRTRTTSARGASPSIRVATTRATSAAASTGGLFALSKGSPNSKHKRAHPILQFFNSFEQRLEVASIGNSLKYESEVSQGKIRLITLGEFVRAYNHSAWLFYPDGIQFSKRNSRKK